MFTCRSANLKLVNKVTWVANATRRIASRMYNERSRALQALQEGVAEVAPAEQCAARCSP